MALVPQPMVDKADEIRQTLQAAVDAARADKTLSHVGQITRIAAAYQQAQSDMRDLADSFEANIHLTVSSLQRDVLGTNGGPVTGVDAVSMRDASDRADQLTNPADALALLAKAERNRDGVLARAIASRALDSVTGDSLTGAAWAPILTQFAASRPGATEKLQAVIDAKHGDVLTSMHNAARFIIPAPPEVARMTPGQLAAAAEGPASEPAPLTSWPGLSQPLPPESPYPDGYPRPGR